MGLTPPPMFAWQMQSGTLIGPFETEIDAGSNRFTCAETHGERDETAAVQFFQDGIIAQSTTGA